MEDYRVNTRKMENRIKTVGKRKESRVKNKAGKDLRTDS
jgi:hypothetical protein